MALIGSNGAGKSTCLKALAGILRPVRAASGLSGEELATEPAHRIVARGIVLVPEGRRLFADQTVMDNLLLGAYRRKGGSGEKGLRARAEEYLDRFPILRERQNLARGRPQRRTAADARHLARADGLAAPASCSTSRRSGSRRCWCGRVFDIIKTLRQAGRQHHPARGADGEPCAARGRPRLYPGAGPGRSRRDSPRRCLSNPDVARGYLGGSPEADIRQRTGRYRQKEQDDSKEHSPMNEGTQRACRHPGARH